MKRDGLQSTEAADRSEFKALLISARAQGKRVDASLPSREEAIQSIVNAARSMKEDDVHYVRRPFGLRVLRVGGIAAALIIGFFLLSDIGGGAERPDAVAEVSNDLTDGNELNRFADAAIERIVSKQDADGTWHVQNSRSDYAPALTALSILTLERCAAERYEGVVTDAVSALKRMQRSDGSFGGDDFTSQYNHAFAAYALIEYDKRTLGRLSPASERAVEYIAHRQNDFGAWDYNKNSNGDVGLTLWQTGILTAAERLGWQDSSGTMRQAIRWLERESEKGVFDYRIAIDRQNLMTESLILTQIATESLAAFIADNERLASMKNNMQVSLDVAFGRVVGDKAAAANDDAEALLSVFKNESELYPTLMALFSYTTQSDSND